MTQKKKKRAVRKPSKASQAGMTSLSDMETSMTDAKALNTAVPSDQWDMPAGFRSDGQIATLKDVVDPKVPTVSLGELTPQQRADLVIKRIEQQPDFKVAMVGAGIVDKNRAIAEIKAGSSIGKELIEIEQRLLNNLSERGSKASGS